MGQGRAVRRCKQVLVEAGIDETVGALFRLQHALAFRQLQRGASFEEVAQRLGGSYLAKMARYQRMRPEAATV